MKHFKASALLLALLMLTGCAPSGQEKPAEVDTGFLKLSSAPLPKDGKISEEFVRSNHAFAASFLNALGDDWSGVYSPVSISMILQLAMSGADEAARSAMAETLKIDLTDDEIAFNNSILCNALNNSDGINVANAVLVEKNSELSERFAQYALDFFRAETGKFDFGDPGLTDFINGWVSDKTGGRIDRLLEQVSPDAALVLLNAIDFVKSWEVPFNPEANMTLDFVGKNGTVSSEFMYRGGEIQLGFIEGGQMALLPYAGGDCFMAVMLPPEGMAVNEYVELAMGKWSECQMQSMELWMPKAEFKSDIDLASVLCTMGMEDAFLGGRGFLDKITGEPLQIGQAAHSAYISVNEEGTEASAATAIIATRSMKPRMFCNRPYAMVIVDAKTDAVLFVTAVNDLG